MVERNIHTPQYYTDLQALDMLEAKFVKNLPGELHNLRFATAFYAVTQSNDELLETERAEDLLTAVWKEYQKVSELEDPLLTDIPKDERNPRNMHRLDPELQLKIKKLRLELQNYKEIKAPKSVFNDLLTRLITGYEIDNNITIWEKSFSEKEKEIFQAGLTYYEEDVLEKVDQAFFDKLIDDIVEIIDDPDERIYLQIEENVWYFEHMDIPLPAQNCILNFLTDLEPEYRNVYRSAEDSKRDTSKTEVAFNHLLSVNRTTMSGIDQARKQFSALTPEASVLYGKYNCLETFIIQCMTDIGHDSLEDGISESIVSAMLEKSISYLKPLKNINELNIFQETFKNLKILNVKEYLDTDENPDYRAYTNNIREELSNGNIVPARTKTSDILVNRRSRKEKQYTTSPKHPEKETEYIDFIYEMSCRGIIMYPPIRFIQDILENYPEWTDGKGFECIKIWLTRMTMQEREEIIFGRLPEVVGDRVVNVIYRPID